MAGASVRMGSSQSPASSQQPGAMSAEAVLSSEPRLPASNQPPDSENESPAEGGGARDGQPEPVPSVRLPEADSQPAPASVMVEAADEVLKLPSAALADAFGAVVLPNAGSLNPDIESAPALSSPPSTQSTVPEINEPNRARPEHLAKLIAEVRARWDASDALLKNDLAGGYVRAASQLRLAMSAVAEFEVAYGADDTTRDLVNQTLSSLNEKVISACRTENAVNRQTSRRQVSCPDPQ